MKQKASYVLLFVEVILCIVICYSQFTLSNAFTTLIAFPFEQIGFGLRALSVSGAIGNALALILYIILCISPICYLMYILIKRTIKLEDLLLVLLSLALFLCLYLMINPFLSPNFFGNQSGINIDTTILKTVLGSTVYLVLSSYIILKALRKIFHANRSKLQKYLSTILSILNVLFIYIAFGSYFGDLLDGISNLQKTNTGNEQYLGISYLFLVFQYIVNALPYLYNIFIVFATFKLLKELQIDQYSKETIFCAQHLSKLCGIGIVLTVLLNLIFHILQLIFAKSLLIVNTTIDIPILSISIFIAALLLAQYFNESSKLKEDNDLFI